MKIITILGVRPQFVKAAPVSRIIRSELSEIYIHTGQHYDKDMSDIFFEEMSIPRPDYNLAVGSGTHAKQTADMMVGIEQILLKEKPDAVMIYGDTNSTLAGALAAVKIHIPVIHVEAGLRSFNNYMLEEINRILSDRISSVLFCPTQTAVNNLASEGITKGVYNVGDVMCDAVKYYLNKSAEISDSEHIKHLIPLFNSKAQLNGKWYLATVHRAENTDSAEKLEIILNAFSRLDGTVIFPVHPRTKGLVQTVLQKNSYKNIIFCQPLGYLDMLYFAKKAQKIITDSGGLQKEAYMINTPCVTVREQTEWVETLNGNFNILARLNADDIVNKVNNTKIDASEKREYYGDGYAAEKILKILREIKL